MNLWIAFPLASLLLIGCASHATRPMPTTAATSPTGDNFAALLVPHDAATFNYGINHPTMPPPPKRCAKGYHQEANEHWQPEGGGYFVLIVGCIPNGYYSDAKRAIAPLHRVEPTF